MNEETIFDRQLRPIVEREIMAQPAEARHTKEPWSAEGHVVYLGTEGGFSLSDCPAPKENASRIAACVNACVGIKTDYLETIVREGSSIDNEVKQRIAGKNTAEQQRDEERKKHEASVTLNERLLSDNRILTAQRDELLAIADGINARRQLRGFLVPEDAQDLLEVIAKVKP